MCVWTFVLHSSTFRKRFFRNFIEENFCRKFHDLITWLIA
jgi:hypothetical protein